MSCPVVKEFWHYCSTFEEVMHVGYLQDSLCLCDNTIMSQIFSVQQTTTSFMRLTCECTASAGTEDNGVTRNRSALSELCIPVATSAGWSHLRSASLDIGPATSEKTYRWKQSWTHCWWYPQCTGWMWWTHGLPVFCAADSLSRITVCAVAQHCYNGDVSFLWEKWKLWTPVKSKPLNRLTHNLSDWLRPREERSFQIWEKSVHGGLLRKGVKYNFLCDFFIYLFIYFLGPT